jgi:metallo-beta-lactamase class B
VIGTESADSRAAVLSGATKWSWGPACPSSSRGVHKTIDIVGLWKLTTIQNYEDFMNKRSWQIVYFAAAFIAGPATSTNWAQNVPPDHPSVTEHGKTWNPRTVLDRNQGKDTDMPGGDMVTVFPPHKIIDNVYYVGTKTLSTFLIVTPEGDILLDTGYERSVRPIIEKSVEKLGFKFTDIKYVLNNHDHGDHAEGDALVKELTGAQVVAIAEGVPGLQKIKPEGKDHPIDKVIHDGDSITLGGTTLTAHLMQGHATGGTTWTMKATEGGKTYDVVFFTSIRPPGKITPATLAQYNRTFLLARALPCDVPLEDHAQGHNMYEKYAKIKKGAPNPYIDPAGCDAETDMEDSMVHALLEEQEQSK